jgi:ABC-type multidrug transport system ATPase subunit
MTTVIEAEGLTKRFGSTQALKGVDISAEQGSVLALLGPNGAGKTTIVRILSTLLKPDGGRARVCGYDVVDDAVQVRQLLALTGQYASVDEELTGTENLIMICRLQPGRLPGQGPGDARPVRPDRGRRTGGQDLLRRHAAPARPGCEPARRP